MDNQDDLKNLSFDEINRLIRSGCRVVVADEELDIGFSLSHESEWGAVDEAVKYAAYRWARLSSREKMTHVIEVRIVGAGHGSRVRDDDDSGGIYEVIEDIRAVVARFA